VSEWLDVEKMSWLASAEARSEPGAPAMERQFETLMREHGPTLWRLTAAYDRNEHERQDLFQDICVAIWKALPAFRGEASIRTYLLRIAHNRGLSHRGRRRPKLTDLEEAEALPDPRAEDPAADTRRTELLDAIRTLPPIYREALTLRLEGLTAREIAEVLGISENNVAVRLSRARDQLRQSIERTGR
jgi:RNA polymerase sigma-70 factor (ECF subfamily)